jgi:hypothetical protein
MISIEKYPKRSSRENRMIDNNPFGDKDKDKVMNWFDCKPLNKKKQGWFEKKRRYVVGKSDIRHIDKSVRIPMKRINKAGFETIACCSGLKKEHKGVAEGAYVSIEIPESIAPFGFSRGPRNKFSTTTTTKDVKDYAPIKKLIQAGEEAGWKGQLSRYLFTVPTVSFYLPKAKDVQTERLIDSHPKYIEATRALYEERHTGKDFLKNKNFDKKLEKRDKLYDALLKKYGKSHWTDERRKKAWEKLTSTLEKLNIEKELSKPEVLQTLPEKELRTRKETIIQETIKKISQNPNLNWYGTKLSPKEYGEKKNKLLKNIIPGKDWYKAKKEYEEFTQKEANLNFEKKYPDVNKYLLKEENILEGEEPVVVSALLGPLYGGIRIPQETGERILNKMKSEQKEYQRKALLEKGKPEPKKEREEVSDIESIEKSIKEEETMRQKQEKEERVVEEKAEREDRRDKEIAVKSWRSLSQYEKHKVGKMIAKEAEVPGHMQERVSKEIIKSFSQQAKSK